MEHGPGARGVGRPRHARGATGAGRGGGVRWSSPQVMLAGLLLVVSLVYLVSAVPSRVPAPAPLGLATTDRPPVVVEVRYVVVDALGLERPGYADAALPTGADDATARLQAALGALRADLLAAGVWPREVEAPTGYVLEFDRRRIAVVDVPALPRGASLDVARELAVARSLIATARVAAAADDVRVTVAGEERPSLWGRVALGGA